MQIIFEKDERLARLIPKQKADSLKQYRLNRYALYFKEGDIYLYYNNLTKMLVALNCDEQASLCDYESIAFNFLAENWFFVEKDFDEHSLYSQIMSLAKMLYAPRGINDYTILPSTDCNARCYYCYEHGCKKLNMDELTALKTVEFIKKSRDKNAKVTLHWFGGEPLFNLAAIDTISQKLKDGNIEFSSTMISNGFAFDKETAKKARGLWNLKSVQITLDGVGETYNKIKAYTDKNEKNPFERVISNIKMLLKAEIKVEIRLNLGLKNFDDLKSVVEYISQNFEAGKGLIIYTHSLFENREKPYSKEEKALLSENERALKDLIENYGFEMRQNGRPKLLISACMADNAGSVMVLPDGKLGLCDRHIDSLFLGDLDSGVTNTALKSEWSKRYFREDLCKSCVNLPSCRRLENCPNFMFDCDEGQKTQKRDALIKRIKSAYEAFRKD